MTLNCLIVEDEPLAAQVVADYIGQVPGLRLAAICDDAFQAMEFLQGEKTDLLFLDIHLPRLNGLDFMKAVKPQCQIILTTAYHQHAVESYELNVTDYLLKPIEFNRFLQAVNKAFIRHGQPPLDVSGKPDHYFFNVDKTRVKVQGSDILYAEALKDYVRIYTVNGKIITKTGIGELSLLLHGRFIRIHKSFLINTDQISAYSSTRISLGATNLPIGRIYRKAVGEFLRSVNHH